jgi:hypothetical protein
MADRLLRHTPSGVLYVYQPVYAQRSDFEEVIDVESRVIPEPEVVTRRKPKPKVEAVDNEALSEEASRNLP